MCNTHLSSFCKFTRMISELETWVETDHAGIQDHHAPMRFHSTISMNRDARVSLVCARKLSETQLVKANHTDTWFLGLAELLPSFPICSLLHKQQQYCWLEQAKQIFRISSVFWCVTSKTPLKSLDLGDEHQHLIWRLSLYSASEECLCSKTLNRGLFTKK